ncbi:beta-4-adaptin [Chloropicon primus]|uniref:Beta-adaptin-like protein n=1 Tax=Chloropicon primus TaxID=1764295 RepID=A0A5B8MM76_9CHLO|nr:beta-4-adaptin [Chloropicon primus]UPQ99671.1 beta-4-adaptin [Chloropicon primus]|mmetsp:Transcript_9657/g.27542  ORF Transcript_9657/g.27542 Transcript_9657/m.27542 type:complete len:929 (-) Transcript_9657:1770-4556(-)|eukprot:QDZ20462.1 beta-4-adaptin [Chloropicon primus]
MSSKDAKRFFNSGAKKGEIHELKQELKTPDKSKKKDVVKKVIAAMTVGHDVAPLFPDVVNCMQTDDMELKKLVYLYLINYAKTQPDLTLMAVNTFVKDSLDPSPLIRALAVRTMGCIRVDKITEYLCDPLARCLKDSDPYVRKTSAVCVAKLYDISPELVEERGFLENLKDMISDANPMVVANSVAALSEIHSMSGKPVFDLNSQTIFKLLAALNECTEWGQVFILDSLVDYNPKDSKDAESVIERIIPRLQHANCAVVLSALKVILKFLRYVSDNDFKGPMMKKLAAPLITLLNTEPQVQYVALRNINIIIQRHKEVLSSNIKVFFCKYNDPIYVKMEKLEALIKLANEDNIDQLLLEFKEYSTEIDVDFVRKSVRAIGRCAVSIAESAQKCINVLLDLIETRVNYVVQEAVIVIKDIFRKYPNKYESIISTLCENLDTLDEPEAKASMVWIIGEYADRIDNADELLETFLETFPEETSPVQLQLLTATVKLFLKKPTEKPQQMIQLVLSNATQETDNPDLRDRAYIYWRLLSTDPEAAKDVILSEKPIIADDTSALEPEMLDELMNNIGTLASVYQKLPDTFVARVRPMVQSASSFNPEADVVENGAAGDVIAEQSAPVDVPDLLGGLDGLNVSAPAPAGDAPAPSGGAPDLMGDLLSLDVGGGAPAPAPAQAAPAQPAGGFDPFGLDSLSAPVSSMPVQQTELPVILAADKGKGLEIRGKLERSGGQIVYNLSFRNTTAGVLDGLMIQFNKNSFGLLPGGALQVPALQPGSSGAAKLPINVNVQGANPAPARSALQVAIKCSQLGVLYLSDTISLGAVLTEEGRLQYPNFQQMWQAAPPANSQTQVFQVAGASQDAVVAKLESGGLFCVGKQMNAAHFSGKLVLGALALVEVAMQPGSPAVQVTCKSQRVDLLPLLMEFVGKTML